jgi:hypothetical protein
MPDRRPEGAEAERARDLGPVEALEGARDIGKKRRGDEVAQSQADGARDEGQEGEFQGHEDDQQAERHAHGAERADRGAALLEGEAHGAVDDEQAHGEAEEPEGGEVEVEAVGEGADVGVLVGGLEAQVGGDLGQRRLAEGLGGGDEEARETLDVQEALGGADVGQGRAGGGLLGGEEGRAGVRKVGEGLGAADEGALGERKAVMSDPSAISTGSRPWGAVKGSRPRRRTPPRRPSTTGLTSQPARRRATKVDSGIVAPVGGRRRDRRPSSSVPAAWS